MADELSVSEEIVAPPERVWAMVSDVTQMGKWSPENEGGVTWLRGATGPKSGAQFQGVNRNGKKEWTSVGTIVECEPGRSFSFQIKAVGLKVAEWRYEFETTPTGCRVIETWIDQRWPHHQSARETGDRREGSRRPQPDHHAPDPREPQGGGRVHSRFRLSRAGGRNPELTVD